MVKKLLLPVFAMFFVMSLFSNAIGQDGSSKPVTPRAAFQMLKNLAGEWTENTQEEIDESKIKVVYRVTALGSALMQTEFPSSDHEMVSMYHMDGDQLMMTHYCAMGNQPKMTLEEGSSSDELIFAFAGGTNMNPEKDAHIHNGRIRFINEDTIESEWAVFRDGKQVDVNRFHLSRIE
jgi:hypothetical protein